MLRSFLHRRCIDRSVSLRMPRYFAHLSFKGTRFHGWQIQPNAATVQETLNNAMTILFRQNIETTGCGRTDAGVHATQFYAHFDLEAPLDEPGLSALKLNALLPYDIRVSELIAVDDSAHARFDANRRSYSYYILRSPDAFFNDYAWYNTRKLDIENMNRMASICREHEDFSCFNKSGGQQFTNNCSIYECQWIESENYLRFNVSANRFLRGMVRAMAGTMLEAGMNKLNTDEFSMILKNKDRKLAGQSLPPKGLFLEEIAYPYLDTKRSSIFKI